ncbi:long-chain-fatty-acid--CoA ligase 1-like isoform X1 [Stegodyphus dumicola]|uniref:long-chain-fatty-acid--CoA ligase 1-like isoform X1 n=1 Tax=Stegodyphus dumicola TaxID=202533 RepID=UPI0015ACBD27|nr:long-chain-fatty-acid--CoA ligase 1-like isoform X1 [Stegodyphus dumicola]
MATGMWNRALRLLSSKECVVCLNQKFQEITCACERRHASFIPFLFQRQILQQKSLEPQHRRKSMKQAVVKLQENGVDRRFLKVHPSPSMMNSQSVVLPGPEKIRASVLLDNPEELLEYLGNGTQTVCDAVKKGFHKSPKGECLGTRSPPRTGPYKWIPYEEVMRRKDYVGSGLLSLGLSASQKTIVGICTKNRSEFVLTLLGSCHYSMILVPMYECFGPDALSHIVSQVDMEVIISESLTTVAHIIENSDNYPNLKYVIIIEANEEEMVKHKSSRLKIMSFKELEELGKSNVQEHKLPSPDDIFCICYTSGTTGQPKGVIISHRNIVSCLASLEAVFGVAIPKTGTLVSYLPCAHIYEMICEIFCLYNSGRIGFYSGHTASLLDDLAELKPTVLPLVPKLMNVIYSAVKKEIGPSIFKRYLLRLALHQKEKSLRRGIVSKNTLWDKLVFSNVQKLLGGSAHFIFTASAPVSRQVMQFFRCASGCLVFEAYGLSEVGAAAMTLMSEYDSGFVGPPLPANHIKLVSVPEMFYDADNNVGEICIRGPNVFLGYYKNPEATKEAFDKDGWHHTGDIGQWLPNGTLAIIDRKKHIFKLAQGEYIAPDKSENVYVQSHIISQVFVDGFSDQEFAVAVVIPDPKPFLIWTKENDFTESNLEVLCQDPAVRKALLSHMLKFGKKKNLNSLHQVGNVYLSLEPFSQENGLLTPTMKLKRSVARKKYEKIFEQMYEEGNFKKNINL